MSTSTYLIYTVLVATVVGLIIMRNTTRHRPALPVVLVDDTNPLGVAPATLRKMVSEMVFYAYGYRPSEELVDDFATRLMAESAMVRGPVNGPSGE